MAQPMFVPGYMINVVGDVDRELQVRTKCKHVYQGTLGLIPVENDRVKCMFCMSVMGFCAVCGDIRAVSTLKKNKSLCGKCLSESKRAEQELAEEALVNQEEEVKRDSEDGDLQERAALQVLWVEDNKRGDFSDASEMKVDQDLWVEDNKRGDFSDAHEYTWPTGTRSSEPPLGKPLGEEVEEDMDYQPVLSRNKRRRIIQDDD